MCMRSENRSLGIWGRNRGLGEETMVLIVVTMQICQPLEESRPNHNSSSLMLIHLVFRDKVFR